MEFFVGHHIKVSGTGQAKDDGFFFARLPAFHRLIHRDPDGVSAFRRGEDALHPRKIFRRFKHRGLRDRDGFHQSIGVELGQSGAHAVIAQAAGVVGRRDKAAAQRVHFCQRADHAGITEIVSVLAAREAGAGGRLHSDDAVVLFAAEFFTHERGNQTAEIAAAARAANDDIRRNAVFVQRRFGF